MMKTRGLSVHLGLLLLGVALFFVWAHPFSFRLGTRAFDFGDSFHASWVLAWDARALFDPHLSIWNAPMFYPSPGTFAFSENLFGLLWVSLPVQWLTGNPILAAQVVVVVAFVLCFYACSLLAYSLTDNIWASVIAGFIFAFHPTRWTRIPHVPLLSFYWALFALLFLSKFFRTGQKRYIWLTAAATCLQYYCSIYLGTMLLVLAGTYGVVYLALSFRTDDSLRTKLTRATFVHVALAALAVALLLSPICVPYITWARYWGFFRDLQECTDFAAEPLSFLKPTGFAHYGWLDKWFPNVRGGEGAAFLGFVPLLLITLGVGALFRARRSLHDQHTQPVLAVTAFFISAIVMAVLMLGPYLIWMGNVTKFPLPYQWIYYFVPGGKAMRCPGRFLQPLILCLSMVIAFGIAYVWKPLRDCRWIVRFLGLPAFALLFCYDLRVSPNDGVPVEPARNFPPVYNYLKKGPADRAVFELPAETDYAFHYLLYQTAHWRPTISGRCSRFTPAAELLLYYLSGFPSDYGLNLLRISPTMTLVVHLDQYDEATRKKWEQANLEKYGFAQQGRFGDALVWERVTTPPASASHLRIANYDIASSELLLMPAEESKPWTRPELGLNELTVRETSADGETRVISVPFRPPPFIMEDDSISMGLPLRRWKHKTVAKVEISGKLVLPYSPAAPPLETEATSLNPDAMLLAKLPLIEGISDGMHVPRNVNILVRAKVENIGKATWLAPSTTTALHKSVGYVSVGLRWYKRTDVQNVQLATGKASIHEGRIPILHDMAPASTATLSHAITVPDQPGEYTVFLEMVSDGVCWFTDAHRSDVLRYDVVVE
jgi:hypothetical protein